MYIRKVLFISKLALALVLAYVVIRTLLPESAEESSTPASARGGSAANVNQAMRSPDLSSKDYSEIIKSNPFDSSGQMAGQGKWSSTAYQQSVSEELGLALSGTVTGSPEVARAIIKDLKTGALELCKVDQIVAGARIESIEKDAIVLVCDGQMTVLKLNIADSGRQLPSPQTPDEMSKVAKSHLPADKAHQHVEALLSNAVIKPYSVKGRVEGLQITGLENINIAKDLGLKNNDVICSVNGHQLTSKQKAFQVFKKAKTQPAIEIERLRDGNTKKLSFSM
ncbi:MAG: type II secretion system protein N [Sedimentisphaerales bacterium]